jgi:Uma2 family endonuclease
MAEAAEKLMTVAEFPTWNDGTDTRYELIDGRAVAMAPVAPSHSVIVANLGATLHGNLRAPCYAGASAGVVPPECDDTFYVADLIVSGTPLHVGMSAIPQPLVVIEVLSPSTASTIAGAKRMTIVAFRRCRRSRSSPTSSGTSRSGGAGAPSGKSRI